MNKLGFKAGWWIVVQPEDIWRWSDVIWIMKLEDISSFGPPIFNLMVLKHWWVAAPEDMEMERYMVWNPQDISVLGPLMPDPVFNQMVLKARLNIVRCTARGYGDGERYGLEPSRYFSLGSFLFSIGWF